MARTDEMQRVLIIERFIYAKCPYYLDKYDKYVTEPRAGRWCCGRGERKDAAGVASVPRRGVSARPALTSVGLFWKTGQQRTAVCCWTHLRAEVVRMQVEAEKDGSPRPEESTPGGSRVWRQVNQSFSRWQAHEYGSSITVLCSKSGAKK